MARVYRHHYVSLAGRGLNGRSARCLIDAGRKQVDHQSVAVRRDGFEHELLHLRRLVQIEDDAIVPFAAHGRTDAFHYATVERRRLECRLGVAQVHDHPMRSLHGEYLVGTRLARIEHHSGGIRRIVQPNAVQLIGGRHRHCNGDGHGGDPSELAADSSHDGPPLRRAAQYQPTADAPRCPPTAACRRPSQAIRPA